MAKIEIKDLEKQRKQLIASFNMWEKTIEETVENMKNAKNENKTKKYTQEQIDDKIELLRNGEQDIIDKWVFLGGSIEDLKNSVAKKETPVVRKKEKVDKTITERINELNEPKKVEEVKPKVKKIETKVKSEPITERRAMSADSPSSVIPKSDETNPLASYDIIPLPSKGECYPGKQGRIAVSYLTAMDENIIISPNLYRDNMVLDVILKEKIRNQEIDPDELLDGDRDAIILFLRASAYGNMYSVTTTDPVTKKQFDTQIDLSKIKFKEFTLVGDENGYFDYETPVKKDKVKFRFLNHRDYVNLKKLDDEENIALRKTEIDKCSEKLNEYLEADTTLSENERGMVTNALESVKKWSDKYDTEEMTYTRHATNELEMQIVSVNGNTDRKFIHDYILSMPIRDAAGIRKYITKNTPGVDYNFEIEKPESLGGGSMKVFLQFDQFIFLVDSI